MRNEIERKTVCVEYDKSQELTDITKWFSIRIHQNYYMKLHWNAETSMWHFVEKIPNAKPLCQFCGELTDRDWIVSH